MKSLNTLSVPFACLLLLACGCKKDSGLSPQDNGQRPGASHADSTYHPSDPGVAGSEGFFMDQWKQKTFKPPQTTDGDVATGTPTDSLAIDVDKVITKVSPYVYGANGNLWMGQTVTQPALVQYITDLSPNIIRGPGGSISDIFFWNQSSQGPPDAPASLMNADGTLSAAGYWYGGNTASWTLSLDNYYALLKQTASTGILTVNYGYARYGTAPDPVAAAAHLAAAWVRYDKGRTRYWEIGNESYGNWEAGYRIDTKNNHDGQPEYITGALYGKQLGVFADSMRQAAAETGATIYIGATLYDKPPASYDYTSIKTWNQGVLENAGKTADFFIVHDYFTGYNTNSTRSDILASGRAVPSAVMSYIRGQLEAAGLAMKPVAMTEWNIQAVGSGQNVSYVAGMQAVEALGGFIQNKFGEASRWDLANGWSSGDDQGMFNIGDEPGVPQWNPRPSFFYLYYFQKFFGDRMVADTLRSANGDLHTYSSTFSSGQAGTIIVNSGAVNHVLAIDFRHFPAGSTYYWYVLRGGTDNGDFSGSVYVNGNPPTHAAGGPLDYATLKAYAAPLNGTIKIKVPPFSVIYLVADG
jgi:hypothetical protein